ncbi:nitrous oxide reductase accessory protein NosL [Desulfuromonas carbonis]|uniref:nitrous oxide reductase accessory protein NosL n=1 Tax=Desulfuromonas sp. DDH964 TaxID=1823759 RepID=UPI00078B347A|nr:nitrous oxide reductase accessory protein NosL [Desulfuromonas sp. DDH964]AMV71452.1 NosL family protein [Desulfuromonas sp. DDH964]
MRGKFLPVFFALLGSLMVVVPATAAEPQPPGKGDRCPTCGMFVAGYPNWVSSMVFKDGSRVFFDGPKDMFRYFFDLGKYRPAGTPDDIEVIFVTEYYSMLSMAATEVYFVSGSDVLGPMGKEIVPVAGLEQARGFMRDHGGAKLMQFNGKALVEVRDAE